MKSNAKNRELAYKHIQAKYWILIFYGNGSYQMSKVVAYTLEDAIDKARANNTGLEDKNMWWHQTETLESIEQKFQPFLK